ncbi:hypothetical protein, partial [Herbaspirillum sp. UBA812]|uniref:hypothetical protein n=1 Tax=Herbaspirillum sp. UBA812 TaxID=1946590 RepID=UPI00257D4367
MNAPLKIDINNIYFLRLCRNIPATRQRFHRQISRLQTFSGGAVTTAYAPGPDCGELERISRLL